MGEKIKIHCSHTELRDPTSLVEHPRNYNTHPAEQIRLLAKIIKHQGWRNPITVSKRSGFVVKGHGRLAAAMLLKTEKVPVDVQDYKDEASEVADMIADNRIAELAEADEDALKDLLVDEVFNGFDLELTGFDPKEIDFNINESEITDDSDYANELESKADELQNHWKTDHGQIWKLGDHRLMCGDSTNHDHVAKLMGGIKSEMMFTDPPYGVDYSGGVQFQKNKSVKTDNRQKLQNDHSTEIYRDFLPVALSFVDGPCYVWFAGTKARDVYNVMHENECQIHAMIVWHKTNATYGAMNSQYKQRHEPCLYFKPKGSNLRWCGDTTEATLWNQDRDGINDFHPTQKPIALPLKAIKNHKVETVYDAFSGSGSTIIASEQLNRKCYAMEISPQYVAVAIQRWHDLTGKKPELILDVNENTKN
jgi:DNA modification methylase